MKKLAVTRTGGRTVQLPLLNADDVWVPDGWTAFWGGACLSDRRAEDGSS